VNDELLTLICDLNADVARMRRCWRPDLIDACLLAYAEGRYELGDGSIGRLGCAFDEWGKIFAGLAMRCYDVRDQCDAEEAAA
jgi:hypothetical protein